MDGQPSLPASPQAPPQGQSPEQSDMAPFLPFLAFIAKQNPVAAFMSGFGANEMIKTLSKLKGGAKSHKAGAGQAGMVPPPAMPPAARPMGAPPQAPPARPNPLQLLALLRARQAMGQGGAPPASVPPGVPGA